MFEIIFYGRGGHGAVIASELTAIAACNAGMQSQSFPFFGGERRGAPVKAFARIDDKPIMLHSQIYIPDVIVVLDHELLPIAIKEISAMGFKAGGKIIMNEKDESAINKRTINLKIQNVDIAYLDATRIATELGLVVAGWPVINTAMLGSFAKVSNVFTYKNLEEAITGYWPKDLAEKNVKAAERGYTDVKFLK